MPEKKPTYPTLAAAKVAAQAQVGAAYKDARNDHAKYPYASKEEIARVAKDALALVGLSFELRGPVGPASDTWIPFIGRFDHESGESDEWQVWWDSDGLRMSSAAAKTGAVMSYAHKNALLNALNIPRETEETHSNRVDQQPNPKSPARRKTKPKKSAAPPAPAKAEANGTPRRDEFSEVLKKKLNCTKDDVDAVVAFLSNGALTAWQVAARDEAACEQLTQAARNCLTNLSPDEILTKAREHRA
jgi:hypothetical protein